MNIYVGNLSFDAGESDVRALFEAYGQVASVSIIEDKFTGRPRGFAFVEMAQDTEAQAAIAALAPVHELLSLRAARADAEAGNQDYNCESYCLYKRPPWISPGPLCFYLVPSPFLTHKFIFTVSEQVWPDHPIGLYIIPDTSH